MGKSILGIAYLAFGFFNIYWSLRIYSSSFDWKDIGLLNSLIARLLIFLDFITFIVILLFTLFILFVKAKAAYIAFTQPQRVLREPVKLH